MIKVLDAVIEAIVEIARTDWAGTVAWGIVIAFGITLAIGLLCGLTHENNNCESGAWTLGNFFSCPVRVGWTVLLWIAGPFALCDDMRDRVMLGGVLAVSVLIHEVAHAIAGWCCGNGVRKITLHAFGGETVFEDGSIRHEGVVCAVGPLANLMLMFVCVYFRLTLDETYATVLNIATYINGFMFIFNMLPGYPLDGGKVFYAITKHYSSARLAGVMVFVAGSAAAFIIGRSAIMTIFESGFDAWEVYMVILAGQIAWVSFLKCISSFAENTEGECTVEVVKPVRKSIGTRRKNATPKRSRNLAAKRVFRDEKIAA